MRGGGITNKADVWGASIFRSNAGFAWMFLVMHHFVPELQEKVRTTRCVHARHDRSRSCCYAPTETVGDVKVFTILKGQRCLQQQKKTQNIDLSKQESFRPPISFHRLVDILVGSIQTISYQTIHGGLSQFSFSSGLELVFFSAVQAYARTKKLVFHLGIIYIQ